LCLDEKTKLLIDSFNDSSLRTIALADVETPELISIKKERTHTEYCWTLTPFIPKWVFGQDSNIERLTYVDADMYFLKSPLPIFKEFESFQKPVMITDHAYDAEYDQSIASGQFCVQFMIFRRGLCEPVRQWWEQRCLEWCYNRCENGKFGDQKYLDEWPIIFNDYVHVLHQLDALLAPWNAKRFPMSRAIAFHFHGLRFLSNNKILLYLGYLIPNVVYDNLYLPYTNILIEQVQRLEHIVIQSRIRNIFFKRLRYAIAACYRSIKKGTLQNFRARIKVIKIKPLKRKQKSL
jgi:hypothetical protein